MKKFICMILLICLSLCACSRSDYSDDFSCTELSEHIRDTLGDGQEYTEFDSTHREFYFEDSDDYDDCSLIYSTDTNDINEIGVFHAQSADAADDIAENCREYIDDMKENSRAFISSYAPAELPKLDNAEVRRFGNYVVYTILPPDRSTPIFHTLKELLTK